MNNIYAKTFSSNKILIHLYSVFLNQENYNQFICNY